MRRRNAKEYRIISERVTTAVRVDAAGCGVGSADPPAYKRKEAQKSAWLEAPSTGRRDHADLRRGGKIK
jgi:hypothetical protein